MKEFVLVVDEGTTAVKSLLFDREMEIRAISSRKIDRIFPSERFVEEDPENIYERTVETMREAIANAGVAAGDIACVAITNQRTSWMFWNAVSGKPICNLVTWQDTRGVFGLEMLARDEAFEKAFPGRRQTLKAISPAVVIYHMRNTCPAFAEALGRKDDVRFGNIDAWLLYKFTGEAHATSYSTVSNSVAFDNRALAWAMDLLEYMGLSDAMMPEIREESGHFGVMRKDVLGVEIPVCAMVADQQAAMFSQGCFNPHVAKCTHGTGTFMNVNIGREYRDVGRFFTSIAWKLGGEVSYMFEGNSFTAGTCLEWAARQLELYGSMKQLDEDAALVPDSGGVFFVPALGGLTTAPYFDPSARASYMGISHRTNRHHFVRATLDSVAYAAASVFEAIQAEGVDIRKLSVSGGVSNSDLVIQLMANLLGMEVVRPHTVEATGLGAAELAAMHLGWIRPGEVENYVKVGKVSHPDENRERDRDHFRVWKKAVARSLEWL